MFNVDDKLKFFVQNVISKEKEIELKDLKSL